MFERPRGGERAVLVHLDLGQSDAAQALAEFRELALAAGAEPVAIITGTRRAPDAKFFAGSGKVDEIREQVAACEAELVLFNHTLSPVQERNLEREFKCRVLDRTGLILDIFAQRARTHEGKLQVELAQLQHLSTRLVRGWTHLERQKGGIGLRGPGETQLETDRRLLNDRIRQLHKKLEKVNKQREQGRRARRRAELPTISLVGYTNAGKSTLFNTVTQAEVYAADQLFATLDPTLRRVELDEGQAVIFADTVGFIRQLPHDLVAAFRSTLQETRDADLLLHVVDAASEQREANIEQVNAVLSEIEAQDRPQLLVYNKIDLLSDIPAHIDRNADGKPERVWLSARSGEGINLLLQAIHELLQQATRHAHLVLPPAAGKLHAKLHALGCVTHEAIDSHGQWLMSVSMPQPTWDALNKHDRIETYISHDEPEPRLAVSGEAP